MGSDNITYCCSCNCMTKSIRKGRADYKCGKCGADKSLGDYYQWEDSQKIPNGK